MTVPKYYYNLNRCISDGKIQFDTTNMPKETYEVNGQTYCGSNALMDLLNEQHGTIEDLKDVNVRCCNEYNHFHKRMMELEKENEQLKQEVQNIHKLINKKIEEADNEFKDYHLERENDIILAKWGALCDLKEEIER